MGKPVHAGGNTVGTERACSSVSSPGLESYLGLNYLQQAHALSQAFFTLIYVLDYAYLQKMGYLNVIFSPSCSRAELRFVVVSENYKVTVEKKHTIS